MSLTANDVRRVFETGTDADVDAILRREDYPPHDLTYDEANDLLCSRPHAFAAISDPLKPWCQCGRDRAASVHKRG
jgi:hypothetical protein